MFEVRDNGEGIPADMLDRVFSLFAQVRSSLDRAQGERLPTVVGDGKLQIEAQKLKREQSGHRPQPAPKIRHFGLAAGQRQGGQGPNGIRAPPEQRPLTAGLADQKSKHGEIYRHPEGQIQPMSRRIDRSGEAVIHDRQRGRDDEPEGRQEDAVAKHPAPALDFRHEGALQRREIGRSGDGGGLGGPGGFEFFKFHFSFPPTW